MNKSLREELKRRMRDEPAETWFSHPEVMEIGRAMFDIDTPELAAQIWAGINSPSKPWRKGDSVRALAALRKKLGK